MGIEEVLGEEASVQQASVVVLEAVDAWEGMS